MKEIYKWCLAVFLVLSSFAPFEGGAAAQAATPSQKQAQVTAPITASTQPATTTTTPINLHFTPNDVALDPAKPILYMVELGSPKLYAVNYVTGELKTLTLPHPAERLDLQNNKLYVTQQKMTHSFYHSGPYEGGIAEVDTAAFTLSDYMDIEADPWDIAVDNQGYIYIAPGSGQHQYMTVFSMKEKKQIPQSIENSDMYSQANIFYNAGTSKIYSLDTATTPTDLEAYEISDGLLKAHYDSIYHGDFEMGTSGQFSPDGKQFYSYGGIIFDLASDASGDMKYGYSFGRRYNDYAFSSEHGLTFAANPTAGMHVYQYGENKLLYQLRKDLQIQKLFYQNGQLIMIAKGEDGVLRIEAMDALSQPGTGLPENPGTPEPAGTLNNLGFQPVDMVTDPAKPVIYMTRPGSKTIYAANLETGEIKGVALPYPAERLELNNHKLYVTQLKMNHGTSTRPLRGAIVEVDTETFTATRLFDIDTDPFDLVVADGYIYVSPGSGDNEYMKVYSLSNGVEELDTYEAQMYVASYLYYNPVHSKLYSIYSSPSPRVMTAYEINQGGVKSRNNTAYNANYPLESFAKIAPDGLSIYNNSGVVFNSTPSSSGDMTYLFKLGRTYNDYTFSITEGLTFAARKDSGIDLYQNNTNKYVRTVAKDLAVMKLQIAAGTLTALVKKSDGTFAFVKINDYTTGVQDPPPAEPDPAPAPKVAEMVYLAFDGEEFYEEDLTDGAEDVPLGTFFSFQFNNMTELDASQIELEGPDGLVELNAEWDGEGSVVVTPDWYLDGDTTYTLTIKKEAIIGESNQLLANDLVITFTTTSNWEYYDGIWYYFDSETGDYLTGWHVFDDEEMYYFNEDGAMQTGWKSIGGKWYYFNEDGHMQRGFLTLDGKTYYLNVSGVMVTGWQLVGGKWYYFNAGGVMTKGWLVLGGKKYFFNTNGIMITGWQDIGGKWYYFHLSGGNMLTGWQLLGGKWYYLQPSTGNMLTGWLYIVGKWYYLNPSGAMQTSWKMLNGKWYYFDGKSGIMQVGWKYIGGKWYFFYANGALRG